MEENKRRFANEIAARLSGAPESDAKSEMIEELAENLARRYDDMTSGGMGEGEAFARALEELGDVDELTAYLNSLEPDTAAQGEAPRQGVDELFQSVDDMGRAIGKMAREAADAAGEFFRSDSFRAGVRDTIREGKQAAREARDYIKKVAGAAWDGASVYIRVDDDGTVVERGDKSVHFGWPAQDSDEEKSVPSQGLLRLDVETTGDVDISLDSDPEAPIQVEGNMSRLDVSVTEDGVLKVRPLLTASNQYFTFRGASSQDVSLTIPARLWESIRVSAGSGDVDMGDELEVGSLAVTTASGDIDCRVKSCQQAALKSTSGDIRLEGNAAALRAETASGDVELDGPMGQTEVSTASGDVELTGSVWKALVKTMSGDVRLESMTQPAEMNLSSKSGDLLARIPDDGPFKVRISSVSGTVDLRPFERWSWSGTADASAPAPQYVLSSISGDVSLDKV